MPRIAVERQIAADPTSAALLLAGPAAVDLWPGARRVDGAIDGEASGRPDRLLVEVQLPPSLGGPGEATSGVASVVLQAHPPLRTPTSFVLRFGFTAARLPETRAVLTLAYTSRRGPAGDPGPATTAALVLDYDAAAPGVAGVLRAGAATFLANLAAVAETRATAA